MITAEPVNWELNIKSQNDWNTLNTITDSVVSIEGPSADDMSLDMTQAKSMRLSFENDSLDQGMHITGYEIEVESTQLRPKGED